MATKFIQKAIKRPGALTKRAKAAGQSIGQYARAHMHSGDVAGDESRFYLNVLAKANKKRKKG